MTLPTWPTPFVTGSQITPAFLNDYIRTQIPKALDGVGGSNGLPYTPSTTLDIQGQGLQFVVVSGKTITMDSGSTLARSGAETLSGVGATTAWRPADGADADTTYDVTYDEIRAPASLGALRTYTLRSTTSPLPTVGNRIRFSRNGVALVNSLRISREGGVILVTLQNTGPAWAEFCYMTAPTDVTPQWRLVAWGGSGALVAAVL